MMFQEDILNTQISSMIIVKNIGDFHNNLNSSFKLQDDKIKFNHSIVVDVIYINNNPVFNVVNEATNSQAARWLYNLSSKYTWNAIRACSINVYVDPPDYIVTNAGTNSTGK